MRNGIVTAVAAVAAGVCFGKGILDVPVSAATNRAYLAGMAQRPWWNAKWEKRAAILVGNVSDAKEARATIDFRFDPGEEVEPGSVRVVTPWETVVPSACGRAGDGKGGVQITFETSLKERENKPFFVYWGNAEAKAEETGSVMTVFDGKEELRINNGVVEATFDNLRRTPGLLKRLKVNASQAPSELLWRTTGYAWQGFEMNCGGKSEWGRCGGVEGNAFKRTVAYTNANGRLEFTLYAGQPRVDWKYRLRSGVNSAHVNVAWACGGGCAYDDFWYVGTAGKVLTFRAALDHVTDCMPQPEYYNFPWISRGWYAVTDRKTKDAVGMVFDRAALQSASYIGMGQSSGVRVGLGFAHNARQRDGEQAEGRGALVATVGDAKTVERAHEFLSKPPRVLIGKAERRREIPVKVPALDRDFCVNVNVGGWMSARPLEGGEWADNIIEHIRALGANTILLGQLTDYGWKAIGLSKELWERACAHKKRRHKNWKPQPWDEAENAKHHARLKKICDTAHGNGMAVCTWHDAIPGFSYGDQFDDEEQALCREFQALYAKAGVDSTFNALGGGEGTPMPEEMKKKHGHAFWKWDDPQPFFDSRKKIGAYMKEFYDFAHKANPGTKVMVFNSDNSELGREMCAGYFPGVMDTLFCEFVAHMDMTKIKHAAKRQRAYFDNVDAKTIHAHFYFMQLDHNHRITQCEMPFICGINGFSQESMTYENFDPDFFEITADFYRFALWTGLGEKAAKMGPVKNLAVLRDMACFEEDCRKKRTQRRSWWEVSRHDARVNGFTEMLSYNYDVVIDAHFNAKSLGRYKAVYVPDNETFSDRLAGELMKFVEAGGGAVVEGATAESCATMKRLGLEDGVVKKVGAGKIVWTKAVQTDHLRGRNPKAIARVKELVAAVGGESPFEIEARSLDGVLQASAEGRFLGVFNRGGTKEKGRVKIAGDAGGGLWALDVKNGRREKFTGEFEIEVGPQQCGYWLIGDEAFTALPEVAEAEWCGAEAGSRHAAGRKPPENPNPRFRPKTAVELVGTHGEGEKARAGGFSRSRDAMVERLRFTADEGTLCRRLKLDDLDGWRANNRGVKTFTARAFAAAVKRADYVHFNGGTEANDEAIAQCGEELKELLKRGGGILFDRNATGPAARKFLGEVGVFDPYAHAKRGVGDGTAAWDAAFPTNHPYLTTNKTKPGWGNGGHVGRLESDGGEYRVAFGKWDAEKQMAPFRAARDASFATLVIQDRVLGAGKVVFNENTRSFNDWYETKTYGNVILSWFIGMSCAEHAELARHYLGGIGEEASTASR